MIHGNQALLAIGLYSRTQDGFDCTIRIVGSHAEPFVRMRIRIDNRHENHRLRARFLGVPAPLVRHDCADVHDEVQNGSGGFLAFTLVRACGTLLVNGSPVAVPAAQCRGIVEHDFRLGTDLGRKI